MKKNEKNNTTELTEGRKIGIRKKRAQKRKQTLQRKPYQSYTLNEDEWKDIFNKIEEKRTSIRKISKSRNIPTTTLRDRYKIYKIQKKIKIDDKRGAHNTSFTHEQEEELANYIQMNYLDLQKPFCNKDLSIVARLYHNKFNPHQTRQRKFTASSGWMTSFKSAWGFTSRRPNISRQASNYKPTDRLEFVDSLSEAILSGVPLSDVYNMDETYWRVHNIPIKTFARKGSGKSFWVWLLEFWCCCCCCCCCCCWCCCCCCYCCYYCCCCCY